MSNLRSRAPVAGCGIFAHATVLAALIIPAAQAASVSTAGEGAGPLPVTANPWDLFNDTFPANETPGLPGTPAFDTTAALVKIGLNIAPRTGDLTRYVVPGDSLTVRSQGDSIRLDLVFRILPGVGNYRTIGYPASGLRRVVTDQAAGAVTPADGTFFGSFMANPGAHSGPPGRIDPGAAIAAHAATPGGWNSTVWNSARMDTSEGAGHATFPLQALGIQPPPTGVLWCSNYHEAELAERPSLGIPRNRCFVIDTTVSSLDDSNLHCGDPSKGPFPPDWVTHVPESRTGWDGTTWTVEGTKIIPDGLLTPGAHVQYFVRRQDLHEPPSVFAMLPDTDRVCPQPGESSEDGHRWQQFGVLPDRWKDSAFGGLGRACFLVIDCADGRGSERVWKGVADSIGFTAPHKRGAADGYGGVPGGGDVNDPGYFVAGRNMQPGTLWDLYQIRGVEDPVMSAQGIGGRLGYRGAFSPMADNGGKWTRNPPTPDMLDAYYDMIIVLTGDRDEGIWGPFPDQTADDVTVFTGWLGAGDSAVPDRGILVIGDGFVEAAARQGPPQQDFVKNFLGTTFVDGDYRAWAADERPYIDVEVGGSVDLGAGDIYGVANGPGVHNDVVQLNAMVPNASVNMHYVKPDRSLVPLGVHKGHDAVNPWISQTIAVDLASMRGRFGSSLGRLAWIYSVYWNVFGAVNCNLVSPWRGVVDVPGVGRAPGEYMRIDANPVHEPNATIRFGLALDDEVELRIYDVSGRLVRCLAKRRFGAGEHTLAWDGADDDGRRMPPGVYLARLVQKSGRFHAEKKVTILR